MRDDNRSTASNDRETGLETTADYTSRDGTPQGWSGLAWLFPAIGVPMLLIDIFVTKPIKDAWILQGVAPAFLVFSVLLGLGLVVGDSRLALPNAAVAFGLLAIIPSLKYGFVYNDFDGIGHYSTALQIVQTGSLAGISRFAQEYGSTPLLHISLAMNALTAALPVEATIVCTLFMEHFLILVLLAKSVMRIFPQIDRRLTVFCTLMTAPLLISMVGTTFALPALAMLAYLVSTSRREAKRREVILTTTVLIWLLFSHFVSTLYFFLVLVAYASLLIMTRSRTLGREFALDPLASLFPRFLVIFLFWLFYLGPGYLGIIKGLAAELFQRSPLPTSASRFPVWDLVQIFLFQNGRMLFSVFIAASLSSIGLLKRPKTDAFRMFWFLMGGGLLMGTMVALGFGIDNIFRFSMYASIASPFFLCFFISRNRNSRFLLSHPRIRVVGVIMLISILLSTFAAYPITPLYPRVGGSPVLDDNGVNSVFVVSGLKHFASVYSSGNVVTSIRIFQQLMSLHREMLPLAYNKIFPGLEDLSPTQVKGELVIFDAGGESGTATLAMRDLAPNLRSRLGIVYTNGFFYLGMAT